MSEPYGIKMLRRENERAMNRTGMVAGLPKATIDCNHVEHALRAYDAQAAELAALRARVAALEAALRELVALKDMHDQFDAMKQDVATAIVLEGIGREYRSRKPAAWERARALLSARDSHHE